MSRFTLTSKAKSDLKEIGRYTLEHWGQEQLKRYLTMFDACFQQLAANPLKGQDCSNIKQGYRKFSIGSHVVFYHQVNSDMIEIVRVLHGRMDLQMRLSKLE